MKVLSLQQSDAELVAAACQGDLASFGRLYERHYRMAVGLASSRLSDGHLAEDAGQREPPDDFRLQTQLSVMVLPADAAVQSDHRPEVCRTSTLRVWASPH